MRAKSRSNEYLESGPEVDSVLLISGNKERRNHLKELLTEEGKIVKVASDGGQAHAYVRMSKPDIVLTELILPGESGFEICEWIKRTEPSLPVVAISPIELQAARELAERVGMDGFIQSPFNDRQLTVQLQEVITAAWKRQEKKGQVDTAKKMISFLCLCGKRMKAPAADHGKSVACDDCSRRIEVPVHYANADGLKFWPRVERRQARSDNVEALRFLTIKCRECATSFQLFPGDLNSTRSCPRCNHEQKGTLSIQGTPLSNAALAHSLRVLVFKSGKLRGKRILLPEKAVLIGRSEECLIRNKSPQVSRQHCRITPVEGGLKIEDLDTQLGTLVNGERITEPVIMRPGDTLQIAALMLKLHGNDRKRSSAPTTEEGLLEQAAEALSDTACFLQSSPTAREAAHIIEAHWTMVRKQTDPEAVS